LDKMITAVEIVKGLVEKRIGGFPKIHYSSITGEWGRKSSKNSYIVPTAKTYKKRIVYLFGRGVNGTGVYNRNKSRIPKGPVIWGSQYDINTI